MVKFRRKAWCKNGYPNQDIFRSNLIYSYVLCNFVLSYQILFIDTCKGINRTLDQTQYFLKNITNINFLWISWTFYLLQNLYVKIKRKKKPERSTWKITIYSYYLYNFSCPFLYNNPNDILYDPRLNQPNNKAFHYILAGKDFYSHSSSYRNSWPSLSNMEV